MGFRFRKSIRIAPGIRLNVGSRGMSATIGPRGASVNVGPGGAYANVGIPGTGISSRTRLDATEKSPPTELAPREARSGGKWWVVALLVGIAIGLLIAAVG
jgi:hypothetical protein